MQKVKLLVAFLWVGVPLTWGVYQSVKKSLPLFGVEPAAAAKPAAR